ncbi:MAG: hypothetical protein JW737_03685 [Acidobacteria bacterium]|nr:hypothetical protein [Acidobacteriota bacterium]
MIILDPPMMEIIDKKINLIKTIWFAFMFFFAVIYFGVQSISFQEVSSIQYIEYVFILLAFGELVVIMVIRNIRFKPHVNKQLLDKSFDDFVANCFNVEIVTFALTASVIIYGIILYILSRNLMYFQAFAVVTVVVHAYFFPSKTKWIKVFESTQNLN